MATKAREVQEFLAEHNRKELLRFLTCGSVDDGKSTLIGRLLHDSKLVYEDTLASLKRESAQRGSAGGEIDYSLLVDGLKAEREQGITIDVAYRYFSTPQRKFIIADTPGHEQYTRNMATGASSCDLAIILIDARQGVLTQTRRHSFIVSLLGIRHVVVAINKMDLVDYDEAVYDRIKQEYSDFSARLGVADLHFIPMSALAGDNVVNRSERMPWYQGKPLLNHLETVHIASDRNLVDFRLPVQLVNRPDSSFRGYCGTVASGVVRPGDEIMTLPSRRTSSVREVLVAGEPVQEAFAPMAVTVTLNDEIDISRGDVLAHPNNVPRISRQFDSMLVWMNDDALVPGRNYLIKLATSVVAGTVARVRYRVDVNSLRQHPAESLALNEIGRVSVNLTRPLCFDDYASNRATGSFIIIDPLSNATMAAGMVLDHGSASDERETMAQNQALARVSSRITAEQRAQRLHQTPFVVWITGLPKSGKTPLAYALEEQLFQAGYLAQVLNGSDLRHDLNQDLGFSPDARSENVRRAAGVARVVTDGGLIAIVSMVSPFAEDRARARESLAHTLGRGNVLEVHAAAPLAACQQRDQDGIYAKALAGQADDVPGVNLPYEAPEQPDLALPTDQIGADEAAERVMSLLRERGLIRPAQ